jgi:CotH kinase protein/Lamin Tail Domain/Secretion system C-terminal sorting domain
MRCLSLLLLPATLLTWLPAHAQSTSFYDIGTVQDISLTFDQANWDYQLDTAKAGADGYILAARCVINGEVFDSVGVKYKGNSSYNASNAKNPLHIELDHFREQSYQNYVDVKLANGFSDPSFVREALSYSILGDYMDAPRANFARVTVNGAFYGLMTNVESISKRFLSDHFYASDGVFFKCNPIGGAGPGSSGASDLRYLGATASAYANSYELKSATGWDELLHLCDTLNNHPADLSQVLDIDRAIWMLAFNNVLVNLDSYSGAFRQNYYLYRDADHRFRPIVWDLNMAFGSFQMLTAGGGGGALDTTAMKTLAPSANSTSALHPLIQKIWNTPHYRRMYLAHIKTIADDLASGTRLAEAQQMQNTIGPDVFADTHKFYTNAQFTGNLTAAVVTTGGGGPPGRNSVVPGVFRLLTGRLSYLSTAAELAGVPPTVAVPLVTPAVPALNTSAWVTTTVSAPAGSPAVSSVLLGYRTDHAAGFRRVSMFDDGLHHDGAAADGVYGAELVATALQMEYFVYAENSAAGIFSPRRAEHEFYSLTATATLPAPGAVVINELLADNVAGQTSPAGTQEDWIELFNTTAAPIDLTGLYLTDNPTTHNKWAFPAGSTIAPNDYLVVWADNGTSTSMTDLHANFKLSKNGEYVLLSDGGATVLDSVEFGTQVADSTWGRLPNGTGPWRRLPATFGAMNQLIVTGMLPEAVVTNVELYPNPADATVTVRGTNQTDEVMLINSIGQEVRRYRATADALLIPTADLPPGIYWVQVSERVRRKLAVVR